MSKKNTLVLPILCVLSLRLALSDRFVDRPQISFGRIRDRGMNFLEKLMVNKLQKFVGILPNQSSIRHLSGNRLIATGTLSVQDNSKVFSLKAWNALATRLSLLPAKSKVEVHGILQEIPWIDGQELRRTKTELLVKYVKLCLETST